MPDYAVRNAATGDVRIVTARHPSAALAHVVTPMFNVTLATAADGIAAGQQGRRVEIAGEEPEVEEARNADLEQSMADAFTSTLPNAAQRVEGEEPAVEEEEDRE